MTLPRDLLINLLFSHCLIDLLIHLLFPIASSISWSICYSPTISLISWSSSGSSFAARWPLRPSMGSSSGLSTTIYIVSGRSTTTWTSPRLSSIWGVPNASSDSGPCAGVGDVDEGCAWCKGKHAKVSPWWSLSARTHPVASILRWS